jgi:hypothetical protein
MPNAAVLPLPVGALAKMSRPARATGIAAFCMGVASVYLKSSMPRKSAAFSWSSVKIEMVAYLSVGATYRPLEKSRIRASGSISQLDPGENLKTSKNREGLHLCRRYIPRDFSRIASVRASLTSSVTWLEGRPPRCRSTPIRSQLKNARPFSEGSCWLARCRTRVTGSRT